MTAPDTDFEELRVAQVAKIGENILLSRDAKLEVDGTGLVAAYIHTGAKVGVLLQVGACKEDTLANDDFKVLVKDITLHIAASAPASVGWWKGGRAEPRAKKAPRADTGSARGAFWHAPQITGTGSRRRSRRSPWRSRRSCRG